MIRRWLERLVLCGLLILPLQLSAQPPPSSRFHPQLIGLTAVQQQQLEAFFVNGEKERREVGGHLRDLYRELESNYDNFKFNAQRTAAIRQEILNQQRRLLALHEENENRLRQILTEDQFAKLRAQMKAWRSRQHHNHGPRPEGAVDRPGQDDRMHAQQ
jgi:Spy/CpxP family protein refolding chaperone